MYVILKWAAVWQDSPPDSLSQAVHPKPRIQTLWATTPIDTAAGRCIAVRLIDNRMLKVCVQSGQHRFWLPANDVLTHAQARHWARTGFGKK